MADEEGQEKDDNKDRGQSPRRLGLNREGCWKPGKQLHLELGEVTVGSRLRKILF